jgi:hypothetical protein
LKKERERGTLELTWWPGKRRLWFKIQAGRTGDWIDEAIPTLSKRIRRGMPSRNTGFSSARKRTG